MVIVSMFTLKLIQAKNEIQEKRLSTIGRAV